jgi:hypothetical protein
VHRGRLRLGRQRCTIYIHMRNYKMIELEGGRREIKRNIATCDILIPAEVDSQNAAQPELYPQASFRLDSLDGGVLGKAM